MEGMEGMTADDTRARPERRRKVSNPSLKSAASCSGLMRPPLQSLWHRTAATVLLLLLALAPGCLAWWAPLHMTVAEIASRHLTDKAGHWTEMILENDDIPGHRFEPSAHDIVEASHWADDIKLKGVRVFTEWHHSSTPIVRNMPPDFTPPPMRTEDVLWALQEAEDLLLNDEASTWSRSLMMRLLIHFAGDLHQPMHAATLYSESFPDGDRGGTRFPVTDPTNPEIKDLHGFWDWGAGVFPDFVAAEHSPSLEYSRKEDFIAFVDSLGLDTPRAAGYEIPPKDLVSRIADQITREHPYNSFPPEIRDSTDFSLWKNESFKITDEIVYGESIVPGGSIPEEYRRVAQDIIRERVALGGYRLAAVLNNIFHKDRKDGPEVEEENYNLRLHEIILYVGFGLSFLANLWLGYAYLKRRERPAYGLNEDLWTM